jgi:hypothetical protein
MIANLCHLGNKFYIKPDSKEIVNYGAQSIFPIVLVLEVVKNVQIGFIVKDF